MKFSSIGIKEASAERNDDLTAQGISDRRRYRQTIPEKGLGQLKKFLKNLKSFRYTENLWLWKMRGSI
jgi:hypothetical protein